MDLNESTTAMNFTENQHGAAILEKLRSQKDNSRFCDVVFHLQDTQYHAHRNILAACSPYFESMLKMKDGKEHMSVNCNQHHVFDILLTYVYTGKVVIDEDNIHELLQLANQFMISKLKGYCSEYLERSMHVGSVFRIKEMAEKCGLPQLAKTADAFIFANLMEIIEQEEILVFSSAKLDNLLSHKSIPLTEDMRLHIICRWVKHDLTTRQYSIQSLLSHIQWERINIQSLYNLLGVENNIFLESEWCMFQILQYLDDNRLLFHLYRDTYNNLRQKYKKPDPLSSHASTVERVVQAATASHDSDQVVGVIGTHPGQLSITEEESQRPNHVYNSGLSNVAYIEASQVTLDETDTLYNDCNDSADQTAVQNDEEQPEPAIPEQDAKEKHRRKNIPIKVRIPKSKIKLEVNLPKKRGRPAKVTYKKDSKLKPTVEHMPPKKETALVYRADSGGSDGELIDKDISDDDYVPDEDYISDGVDFKKENAQSKTSRKRKRRKERSRKNSADKINCPKCLYMTSQDDKMEAHINKAHKDDTTFQCGICEFKSKWNREYYHHMKNHFNGPPFRCDHAACDYTAERIQPLLYHRMIHTNERPFACTICNMRFRTRNNLTTHLRCHTGLYYY